MSTNGEEVLTLRSDMRKTSFVFVVLLAFGCGKGNPVAKYQPGDQNVEAGHKTEWTFDADPVGGLPAGAEVFGGTWQIRAQDDAPSKPNVLCQTATAEFPAVCLSDKVYGDLVASVRFKPVSGREDQAAGIIFRVQDKSNYYILRANALENNVNFYIYAGGKRSSLTGSPAKVAKGEWQELKVEVVGNQLRGFLNGALVVEADDDAYKVGRVGLWTKADSVTCFDNVQVTAK
jgi:Domain of Unknown Function (DUF1080)